MSEFVVKIYGDHNPRFPDFKTEDKQKAIEFFDEDLKNLKPSSIIYLYERRTDGGVWIAGKENRAFKTRILRKVVVSFTGHESDYSVKYLDI